MAELQALPLFADSGLKFYGRFESNLNDSSPTGNNLSAQGSPTYAAEKYGNGLVTVRASSQGAKIVDGSQSGLDFSSACSLGGWFKLAQLPSTAGGNFGLLSKYTSTGNQRQYRFFIGSDDKLSFQYSGDGINLTQVFSTGVGVSAGDVGALIHLTATVNFATKAVTFYKNAVSQAVDAAIGSQTSGFNGTADFTLGFTNATDFLDGAMDDVFAVNRVLTAAEVLSLVKDPSAAWYLFM